MIGWIADGQIDRPFDLGAFGARLDVRGAAERGLRVEPADTGTAPVSSPMQITGRDAAAASRAWRVESGTGILAL